MPEQTSTTTLRGGIVGPIWWSAGVKFAKPLTVRLTRNEPLHDEIARVLVDGDFQSSSLTADSFIEIVHLQQRGRTRIKRWRTVEIIDLPSLSKLVDAEAFLADFMED